jgi:glutaredoxin-like protein NrdH
VSGRGLIEPGSNRVELRGCAHRCGRLFQIRNPKSARRYCSTRCRDAAKQQRWADRRLASLTTMDNAAPDAAPRHPQGDPMTAAVAEHPRPTLTLVPPLVERPVTTVYTLPACFGCNKTKDKLDEYGVEYTVVDMSKDPDALAAVRELGYQQAPVVITTVPGAPDDHWSGLRVDKINEVRARWQAANA